MEKQKLPNANAVLILGILSLITCCCYGVGAILGVVALVIAKKDLVLYNENPELYSNYSTLKTGRILAMIGIGVSVAYLIYIIILFSTIGMDGIQQMQNEMLQKYGGA